jgi:TatD DNase family protein
VIDTHAHLDALDDAPAAIVRAREAGVERIITIGTTLDSCRAMLAFAEGQDGVFVSLGLHPHDRQLDLFRAQAQLAVGAGKPIVVHTRAADEETLAVLTALPEGARVVLHCFSSLRLLGPALERGWYCSFAGNVTYPKATELRTAAARVPGDRILAETDSPYLSPQPVRGQPNEPANVVHTLATIAEARGQDRQELERLIDANATAAFGLP